MVGEELSNGKRGEKIKRGESETAGKKGTKEGIRGVSCGKKDWKSSDLGDVGGTKKRT